MPITMGIRPLNRDWIKHALDSLPQQKRTDRNQADRVKDVRRAEEIAGNSQRQDECQIEEHKSHFIRQVVNTVHDETEALGLEPSYGLNNKDCRPHAARSTRVA
jgi:hypothetical protein